MKREQIVWKNEAAPLLGTSRGSHDIHNLRKATQGPCLHVGTEHLPAGA